MKLLRDKKGALFNWKSSEVFASTVHGHMHFLSCGNSRTASRTGKPFRRERHLEVLLWLLESGGVDVLRPECLFAVLMGKKANLKLIDRYVRWSRGHGAPWDDRLFNLAANDFAIPIEALRWLLNSDCPRSEGSSQAAEARPGTKGSRRTSH